MTALAVILTILFGLAVRYGFAIGHSHRLAHRTGQTWPGPRRTTR